MKNQIKKLLKYSGIFKTAKKAYKAIKPKRDLPTISAFALEENGSAEVVFQIINNLTEYHEYVTNNLQELQKRTNLENEIIQSKLPLFLKAYNPLLKKPSDFYIGYEAAYRDENGKEIPNLRETVVCSETDFNSRLRLAVLALEKLLTEKNITSPDIYITEQDSVLFDYLRKKYKKVTGSEYLGAEYKSGTVKNRIRHEDITSLSFDKETFNILITLEVLEHVPDYPKAFQEMQRVLKPGGFALITTPFVCSNYENTIRATLSPEGTIHHILPPEYHGDPVSKDGGILCFQHFGWEILDQLKLAGFSETGTMFSWSLQNGILGKDLMVIYAVK